MTSAKRAEQYGHTSRSNEVDEEDTPAVVEEEDDGILLWSFVEG